MPPYRPPATVTDLERTTRHLLDEIALSRDAILAATAPVVSTALESAQPPTLAQKALSIHPKTAAGGISGSLTVIVLYCLSAIWQISPPPEAAAAATVVISAICAWLAPRAPGGA